MEVIATLPADTPLSEVAARAGDAERLGFDTLHVPETIHDSLAVALLALEHTTRLRVRTSLTVAFPRSPMVVAYAAWDLARFSHGRFELGLATQVRGNIEGRFAVPWTDPAGRLADYLDALRAIFTAFATGQPLLHEGPHYRFDRLQPYFNPGGADVTPPPLWTGGVNERVCRAAAAHADGFVAHPTNAHPRFLEGRLLPWLDEAAAAAARPRPRVVVAATAVTAETAGGLREERRRARRELAFLYATRAYRPTLELLGLEALGDELGALVADRAWGRLDRVLDDETLERLVPVATHARLPETLARWYAGRVDGVALRLPAGDADLRGLVEAIRSMEGRTGR